MNTLAPYIARYVESGKLPIKKQREQALDALIDDLLMLPPSRERDRLLSNVYEKIGFYKTAFAYFQPYADLSDRKDFKRFQHLKHLGNQPFAARRTEICRSEILKQIDVRIPEFKYCADPVETEVFDVSLTPQRCDCCGTQTQVFYSGPFYSVADVDTLCPECIATGRAAETFDGAFIDCGESDLPPEQCNELQNRTPSYTGWQQAVWAEHCGDFCRFVGYVGYPELEAIGLENIVDDDNSFPAEYLQNGGDPQGYLFRCLSCEKYLVYGDCS